MIEHAKWIAATEAEQAPCIEKKFSLGEVRSAILDITGLGYFIAEINGKAVTDDLFNPVFFRLPRTTAKQSVVPDCGQNDSSRVLLSI